MEKKIDQWKKKKLNRWEKNKEKDQWKKKESDQLKKKIGPMKKKKIHLGIKIFFAIQPPPGGGSFPTLLVKKALLIFETKFQWKRIFQYFPRLNCFFVLPVTKKINVRKLFPGKREQKSFCTLTKTVQIQLSKNCKHCRH